MEPLTALALTCNILGLAQTAQNLISLVNKIKKEGASDPALEDVIKEFNRANEALRTHLAAATPVTEHDQAILDLGKKCEDSANSLRDQLESFSVHAATTSKPVRILLATGKAIKATWSLKETERLRNKFAEYRQLLDTEILINLRLDYDLNALKQAERFDRLDASLQDYILKLLAAEVAEQDHTRQHVTSEVDHAVHSGATHVTRELDRVMDVGATHLTAEIDRAMSFSMSREQRQELLKSLAYAEMTQRQEQEQLEAYPETFQWIFSDNARVTRRWPSFAQWLRSGEGFYWISGKAGTGKSTLMRYIHDEDGSETLLQEWALGRNIVRPVHFFWAPGTPLQKSLNGMLRSLVYQLLKACDEPPKDMLGPALLTAWTNRQLSKTLTALIHELSASAAICFFIDGLDEMEGDMESAFTALRQLLLPSRAKCVISSRPWSYFELFFIGEPRLSLQDLNYFDILKYVEGKIAACLDCSLSDDEVERVVNSISDKAEGMLLWVRFVTASVVSGLCNGDGLMQLLARVNELDTEFTKLYDQMFSSIQPMYKEQVARYVQVLQWNWCCLLVFSFLPGQGAGQASGSRSAMLRKTEALRMCTSTRRQILQRSNGLLQVQSASDATGQTARDDVVIEEEPADIATCFDMEVSFLHRTVYDYFKASRAKLEELTQQGLTAWDPQVAYTEACVNMLQCLHIDSPATLEIFEDHISKRLLRSAIHSITESNEHMSPPVQEQLVLRLDSYASQFMESFRVGAGLPSTAHWALLMRQRPFWHALCKSVDSTEDDDSTESTKLNVPSAMDADCVHDLYGLCVAKGVTSFLNNKLNDLGEAYLIYLIYCALQCQRSEVFNDASRRFLSENTVRVDLSRPTVQHSRLSFDLKSNCWVVSEAVLPPVWKPILEYYVGREGTAEFFSSFEHFVTCGFEQGASLSLELEGDLFFTIHGLCIQDDDQSLSAVMYYSATPLAILTMFAKVEPRLDGLVGRLEAAQAPDITRFRSFRLHSYPSAALRYQCDASDGRLDRFALRYQCDASDGRLDRFADDLLQNLAWDNEEGGYLKLQGTNGEPLSENNEAPPFLFDFFEVLGLEVIPPSQSGFGQWTITDGGSGALRPRSSAPSPKYSIDSAARSDNDARSDDEE